MPKIQHADDLLPQTLVNLRRVNRILFRVEDQAFQLVILDPHETYRVSTSAVDLTDWAPGFTGDCAFNFMLSVLQTISGRRFVRSSTSSDRYVAFDRQEKIARSRRK